MSMRLSNYFIALILSLIITLISTSAVNAVCYVTQSNCYADTVPASDYVTFQDNQLTPAGYVCDSSGEIGSADQCILGCCCNLTSKTGSWPVTRGYCVTKDPVNNTILQADAGSCETICRTAGSSPTYNFSGYVKRGNDVLSGVEVNLTNITGQIIRTITNTNGYYEFKNISRGYVALRATIGACSKTDSFELMQNNIQENITVDCPIVTLSGIVSKNGVNVGGVPVNVTYDNNEYTFTSRTTAPIGSYTFNIPSNTEVLLKARDAEGCVYYNEVSVGTTNEVQNILLECNMYDLDVYVRDNSNNLINDAAVNVRSELQREGTNGLYEFIDVSIGTFTVTASDTTTSGNTRTTCTGSEIVTITNADATTNVILDSCCAITTSYSQCINGVVTKYLTYSGTCATPGTFETTEGCSLDRSCWVCNEDWTACDNGEATSSQTCTKLEGNCNPNYPPPLMERPCNGECGNGELQADIGEQCDYGTGYFDWTATCRNTWNTYSGNVITDAEYVLNEDIINIVCNPVTCGCNSPPTLPNMSACTLDPGNYSLTASHALRQSRFNLAWASSKANVCPNSTHHFELRACEGVQCDSSYTLINNNIPNNTLNYIYNFNNSNTTYCFELTAVFGNVIAGKENSVSRFCIRSGDAGCLVSSNGQDEWCEDNGIATCDANNNKNIATCTADQTCGTVDGEIACYTQGRCEACNNIFGVYSYAGAHISAGDYDCPGVYNPVSDAGCYLDYSMTIIDRVYSCNETISCYDYYSEDSCATDYCGKFYKDGINQCEWVDYSADGFTNIFKRGVCKPVLEEDQNCGLCSSPKNNRLYPECNGDACVLFGECYFEPYSQVCMAKKDVICGNYTDSWECIRELGFGNGKNVSTNVEWTYTYGNYGSAAAYRSSGNNARDPSTDAVGLGVCVWTEDEDVVRNNPGRDYVDYISGNDAKCVRNADNLLYVDNSTVRFGIDCIILQNKTLWVMCEKDTIPPVTHIYNTTSVYGTYMNLKDQVVVTDNNPWPIGDDTSTLAAANRNNQRFIKTYYCISRGNTQCYPDMTMSKERIVNLSLSGITSNDDKQVLTMYYFSQDPAKNLESIKNFTFIVDSVRPNVSLNRIADSYPYDAYIWHTNLTITIRLLEPEDSPPVTCTFNITPLSDNAIKMFEYLRYYSLLHNIPSISNTGNKLSNSPGSVLTTMYPGLVDGRYKYELQCIDVVGNPYYDSQNFSITGDMRINSPIPTAPDNIFRSDDVAHYNGDDDTFDMDISINTNNSGVCKYTTNPLYAHRYDQMEGSFATSDRTYHTASESVSRLLESNNEMYDFSGVYTYYVGCYININNRNYVVYGTDMSNPQFSIDDVPPATKILYSNLSDDSWIEYNDTTPASDYLRFILSCNDDNPLLTTTGGSRMSFGCNADTTYYCIEEISEYGDKCANISTYMPADSFIELDYQDSTSADKLRYGNNPTIHYYSTDRGGNTATPASTQLRLRNTKFSDPTITLVWNDGANVSYPGDTIGDAFIIISVEYTGETAVNITSIELQHSTKGAVNLTAMDGLDGEILYRFYRDFFDNGKYILRINAVDDDTNEKNTVSEFTVKHDGNAVWLVSPRVGIGQSRVYDINVATAYPGQCRFGYDPLDKCPNKVCIFSDTTYNSFSSTGGRQHTIINYDYTGLHNKMYVICRTSGMLDPNAEDAFVQTSFNIGYNSSMPNVNVTFIQNPRTKPEDNKIINPAYNATIVQVLTDQPSVCMINASIGRQLLDIPSTPPRWFNNEDPLQYSRYYTIHNYTVDYKGTGAAPGIYHYTVNCTSLAQFNSVKGFEINFTPNTPGPVARIIASESYLTLHRYNVTCQGLCMDIYQDRYYYKIISQSAECSAQSSSTFISASYSQLIDVRNSSKICVKVVDVLGRNATAEIDADVMNFNNGLMTLNYPYIYSFGGVLSHVYSPTQRFTLNISTEVASECRYTTSLNAKRYTTVGAIFNNSDRFENTDGTLHTTYFEITATSNFAEGYAVVCRAANTPNNADLYVSRELIFYWDDSAPSVSANVTPQVIKDWNSRDRVTFNVTTNDDSRCVLYLDLSTVSLNNNGSITTVALGTGTFALDIGSDNNFTNYVKNRVRQYYLPNTWLNDINTKAVYNFSINCWNRARLYTSDAVSSRYDLDNAVRINRTSGTIFNNSIIPINVTTNINSTCIVIIDDNTDDVRTMNTRENINHSLSINLGFGGNHTIDIECSVASNSNIATGYVSYQVIVDAEIPMVVKLSSTTGKNYTCGVDGFSINVEMSDDIGIEGYYYNIIPVNTTAQFNPTFGNYGLITHDGTLQENTAYTVSVKAVDRSGKYSVPKNIVIIARTPAGSILCDTVTPQVTITTVNTPFLDMIKANVTCTDDTGCKPLFYYTFANTQDCSQATYSKSDSFNNLLTFMTNGLLCVRVTDLAGNVGYGQRFINISADLNNPLNITPMASEDSLYVYPNVLVTSINPFNLSVSTSVDATCRYSRTSVPNELNLTNLYNRYLAFSQSGGRIHTINNFDINEAYETYVDVICYSTALSNAQYSRRVIRVVYTNINPTISATADPELIYDWNYRRSLITVNTLPETWCSISSIGNTDTQNTPYSSGSSDNALTFKTTHMSEFQYNYDTSRIFHYDINCYTLNNMHNSTNVTVRYNISNVLNITLLSPLVQRNRTAEVMVQTSLISECRLVWGGVDKGVMIANVSNRQHYMKIITQSDGVYGAEINCTTPITGIKTIRTFNITINTTKLPVRCGDGEVNQQSEECDGNDLDGRTCTTGFTDNDYEGGELKCTSACKYDKSSCDTGRGWCGNDKVDGPNSQNVYEQCDGRVPSSVTCKSLGFSGGTVTCNDNVCMINTSRCTMTTGTLGTRLPTCNNRILESGEQCELNSTYEVKCTSFGYDSGAISCNNNCLFDMTKCTFTVSTSNAYCGNNKREGTEQCDGTDLNGTICAKLSYTSGTLKRNYTGGIISCYKNNCTFNVTKCTTTLSNATNYTAYPSTCSNNMKDGAETDKDCGGNCPPCATLNSTCVRDSDCSSGKCALGKCIVNTCNNSKLDNATESDIDCGKTCKTCALGKNCVSTSDCDSGYCDGGKCAEDPCSNGVLDSGEVDVDCGGVCASCEIGQDCLTDEDCGSGNCHKEICEEAKPPVNPIKLPLLLFGIITMLGGGGYIIYRTFIEKKPLGGGHGFNPFDSTSMPNSASNVQVPVLTPEQREELLRRQKEIMAKKRQSRMAERKGVLEKLDGEKSDKNNTQSNSGAGSKKGRGGSTADGEYVELSALNKDDEEYIDLGKLKDKKDTESKKTFEKLKKIGVKGKSSKVDTSALKTEQAVESKADVVTSEKPATDIEADSKDTNKSNISNKKKSEEANDVAKKISDISGKPHESIKPKIEGDKKISNVDAMKLFGELGKDTIMSKAFTEVLSKLLKSGKITNENVSNILFEYLDKGLLNKSDVARISSELKII